MITVFPFIMTMLRDLSHLKSIPAHFKAVEHLDNSIWTPETDSDIKSMSSIKALIKGRVVLEEVTKFGALHVSVFYADIHPS